MAGSNWQTARLIPVSGIGGIPEQEARATSALLAVLHSVKEFRTTLLKRFGAPAGTIETFIETRFTLDERSVRPDGLIRITRGSTVWVALVEVKTGSNPLDRQQIESYLGVCRQEKYNAVITISNEIATVAGAHPVTDIAKAKLKSVELHHLSWSEVRSIASVQAEHHGVADPDQAWILTELIRYLDHEKSGALEFSTMGPHWTTIRDAISNNTLRPGDRGLADLVARWDQLLRYAAMRLERKLGSGVQIVLSRKEQADPALRPAGLVNDLIANGTLSGSIRVPNTVGSIDIHADLRRGKCFVRTSIDAPTEGKATTRVNWLLRQINGDVDAGLTVDCWVQMARTSLSEPMTKVRSNPLCLTPDKNADIRRFVISAPSALGSQGGIGGKHSFIDSVLVAIEGFYESVLQDLKPWTPKAPQIQPRDTVEEPDTLAELSASTDEVEDLPSAWAAPAPDAAAGDIAAPLMSWEPQLRELELERERAAVSLE